MTKTKLNFAAALVAAGLLVSLSAFALAEEREADDNKKQQAGQSAPKEIDVEGIHRRVAGALEAVPWAEISQQLAEARGVVDGIDMEGIRAEVEAAMEGLDLEQINVDVRQALEGIDWEQIREDIEHARSEIETMGVEDIRTNVLEALKGVDWDDIRRLLKEAEGVTAEELRAFDEALEDLEGAGSGVI